MQIKVIIPASGKGSRFGGDVPKQFQLLDGQPILKRTIAVFDKMDSVSEIAIAIPVRFVSAVENYGFNKVRHIIEGGESRGTSVYAALKCLNAKSNDIILIHDGARPFVTTEIIEAVIAAVAKHGAAVACSPVTDTIKQVTPSGRITTTLDRSQLWRAQTPQGFTYKIITSAYAQAEKDDILTQATDDSFLVECMNLPVYIVPCPPSNIKITTPEDMIMAQALLIAQDSV